MSFRPTSRVWLALGASLAVSGGIAIVTSLPDGGEILWVGVGLVALGSLSLRMGLDRAQRDRPEAGPATSSRATTPPGSSGIEPELRGPSPRRVQMTARGRAVVLIWTLTLAIFAILVHRHFGMLTPVEMQGRLDEQGAAAVAEFHGKEVRELPDGKTLHFVGYNFLPASGSPVRISRSVTAGVFARLREGETTRVLYMPGNPELHYLPDLTSPVPTRIVFLACGLLLAAAGFAEAQRRLHRRLVASGAAVSGTTANVRRRGGVRSFLVNFDIGGVRRTLKGTERNPDLRNGQRATVLYDPAASTRAVIYRLALYRALT